VAAGVSKRSTSNTSTVYVRSDTVSLSSIYHDVPGPGFQTEFGLELGAAEGIAVGV
jgi:hypothetical protein